MIHHNFLKWECGFNNPNVWLGPNFKVLYVHHCVLNWVMWVWIPHTSAEHHLFEIKRHHNYVNDKHRCYCSWLKVLLFILGYWYFHLRYSIFHLVAIGMLKNRAKIMNFRAEPQGHTRLRIRWSFSRKTIFP